ncbi:MAG: iron ABC transporter permease [Enterocloster citroniae]|nr:iron ABC transporter permease [Enterocloster citroniae]
MSSMSSMSSVRSRRLSIPAAGAGILLFFVFTWPLVYLFSDGFKTPDGRFTLAYLVQLLGDPSFYRVIANTIIVNTGGTLLAASLGILFAFLIAYTDLPCKPLIHNLLLVPLVIPGYIITLAWMQTLGQGSLIYRLTHFPLYSHWGIILIFGVCNYPLLYLLALNNFRKISRELEQAATVSGCRKWSVFFHVTLPLSAGILINAMLLIFLSCLDNFGTVAFIGIPANITVLSTDIYKAVTSFSHDSFGSAAIRAIFLSLIAFGLMWASGRTTGGLHSVMAEKEDMSVRCSLGKFRIPLLCAALLILALINIMPLMTLVMTSLTKAMGVPFRPDTVTLANFEKIFRNSKCLNGLKNSLVLAMGSVSVCAVLGITVSYGTLRRKSKLCGILQHLLTFPYSIPGIILGLGLILTFAKPVFGISIYGSIWILLLAYIIRFTAVILCACNSAFATLDPAMEEAGMSCGAAAPSIWKQIILPLTSAPVLSGMGLVFLSSLMELTTSSILWSAGSETVGVVIFNFTSAGKTNMASAYSTVILLLAAIGFGLLKLSGWLAEWVRVRPAVRAACFTNERSMQS